MSQPTHTLSPSLPGPLELAEPDVRDRTSAAPADATTDWLCAWCLNRIASEQDRFFHQGLSEFRFQNPDGVWFNIFTFAPTIGCRPEGASTLEHSWFTGHAWSFCVCDRCGIHLGWFYSGPTSFAGLIRERLSRACLVRN